MKYLCNLVSIAGILLLSVSAVAGIAIDTSITIKPGNAEEAADKLVKQAELLKGYFVTRSSERVVLKIPNQSAPELQQYIEKNWLIYRQNYQANDITAQMIEAKSNLKAKEDLLEEYQKILASAHSDKLVKVSTSVNNLVQQIELLRGRLNYMQHQLRFARFTIDFQIGRGTMDDRQVTSSFPWLNSVGMTNLLSDFSNE